MNAGELYLGFSLSPEKPKSLDEFSPASRATYVAIVVSDIVMPRLNGVELLQALAVSHPGLPVILMSGYATAALAELGISAPCGILPKPFPAERLLAEVQRCIRRS